MAKNIIVISCDIRETRVALIEDGIIAELHIERKGHPSAGSVGDVVLGKVTRVLPGLQAAFIDVGQERAAFLHVEDLIRPDDFETYLAGGRKHAMNENEDGPGAANAEEVTEEPSSGEVHAAVPGALEASLPLDRQSIADVQAEAEALAEEQEVEESGGREGGVASEDNAVPAPAVSETRLETADRIGADAPSSLAPEAEYAEAAPDEDSGESSSSTVEGEGSDDDDGEGGDFDADWDTERTSEVMERAATASEAPQPRASGGAPPATAARVDDLVLGDDLPGFTITEPGEPIPRAPVAPRGAERGGGRRRRGRGRGRDEGRGEARGGGGSRDGRGRSGGGRESQRSGAHGRSNGSAVPNRISKSTPIRDVVREGQEIIVQISKDPIGTKGARCTSHISLPGRYVVYLPTVEHIGVSKRIGSEKERARLRESIEGMKPPSGGLIVRTVAEGLTKKQLKADVGYLVRLWGEIAKKREGAHAPQELWSELDLVLKTARDLFTDEIDQMVIDEKGQYDRVCRFVEMFAPERVKDILYYNDEEPIFDAYGIEDEIGRALARKVPLPSGGYLIIDQAEALTAIDVNTGRYVGKGAKDMEETILKTNLEAVNEIAYQLRFRNIGGLIILDLIDMENRKNRETVRRTLEQLLEKDKAKTTLNRISELGLIEMTRKRTRESLGRLLHEPCFYCDGTGQLQSKETIAYEILREIRRKRGDIPGYTVVVNAHPAVADLLTGAEKAAVAEAENRYMRKIAVVPRKDYHLEQFDLSGK
ncbi:MAG: Rne/Rng family ribonuclease [Polyangiaceae bacterium]